jgi:hypothetical protein
MPKTTTQQAADTPVTDEELRADFLAQVRVGASVEEQVESAAWSTVGMSEATVQGFVKAFRATRDLAGAA